MRRIPRANLTSLLDVGCGTGTLLDALAAEAPDCRIAGIDLSYAMASAARARLPRHAQLFTADAEMLPFRAAAFDVVVSSSSFHFWPDPVTALRECRRVLRPEGRLVLTDWCDDFLTCRVCDRFLRLRYGSGHRIYSADECAQLLRDGGFEPLAIDRYKISWLWGLMTAVARPVQ